MAIVITHPEMGIFLGSFLGLGIWSKLDPAGLSEAVTFDSSDDAEQFMKSWDYGRPDGAQTHEVTTADGGRYATVADCVSAYRHAYQGLMTSNNIEAQPVIGRKGER